MTRDRARWTGGVLAVALGGIACTSRAEEVRALRLVQVRPEDTSGVFLNEGLTFHFSEPLDPTSVTGHSVRIVARNQERTPARGALRVSGRTLSFAPAPVLSSELDDGGYLPDTDYTVELGGFPRPDGLRGRSGAPLQRSVVWEFRTVSVDEPRVGYVFEDATLGRGLPVILHSDKVSAGDPILLEAEEPLDPSTLFAGDFVLRRKIVEEQGERVRPPLGPPVPLRARLLDNRDRRAPGEPGQTTLIELLPFQPLDPGHVYWLDVDPANLRLRDFGGHKVPVFNSRLGRLLEIEVRDFRPGSSGTYLDYTETFMTPDARSGELVDGVDGTVAWGSTGRAEVRWPAAAGDGEDGEVRAGRLPWRYARLVGAAIERVLRAAGGWDVGATRTHVPPDVDGEQLLRFLGARDVRATRFHVPQEVEHELPSTPGLVVVRAQGSIRIDGALTRHTGAGAPKDSPFPSGDTLSDWLAHARREDLDCTVLIAGGDLIIEGTLEVDGPLLIVAGGRTWVSRSNTVRAARAVTLGGGAPFRYVEAGQSNRDTAPCPLVMDLATENLLRVPLTYGVRSAPIPREGGAARWHSAPRVGAHEGAGSVRVRYLSERRQPSGQVREVAFEDPAVLEDSPTLRLEILLEVGPGAVWDPPWVDSIQVRWDPLR